MGEPDNKPLDQRPTYVRFGVLGFLCTLSTITYLDRICIMRVRGEMQTDLGFDDTQMGYVFAAFYLGYALFEVPAGWMGDAWGSRSVLTRIVLLWSIFTGLHGAMWQFSSQTAFTATIPFTGTAVAVTWVLLTMVIVRFMFGAGEAGAFPNIARITGTWFPFRERGLAQGLVWMSARLGGAVAPLIIGRLAVALTWRGGFAVLGSVGAIWAVAFYLWFRNSPQEHPSCNEAERAVIAEGAISAEVQHVTPPWGQMLRLPSLYALCVASATVSFGWYFYATWQPLFFKEVHGVDATAASSEISLGLPFVCGAVGCLVGGWLSDVLVRSTGRRWGRSLMGMGGYGMAGLCFLASAFAPNAFWATVLLCTASFFNDLAIPPIWAACADIGGRYSGTLSGIMNMAGGIGSVTCPIFIPVLNTALMEYPARQRWLIIFGVLSSAWFIGAIAWACINAGRPLKEATQ
jgi:MFS family permease